MSGATGVSQGRLGNSTTQIAYTMVAGQDSQGGASMRERGEGL